MSRRPGLGYEWWRRYRSEIFPADQVVLRGRVLNVPKYYDELEKEEIGEEAFEKIQNRRIMKALRQEADHTPERLAVREEIRERWQSMFGRDTADELLAPITETTPWQIVGRI